VHDGIESARQVVDGVQVAFAQLDTAAEKFGRQPGRPPEQAGDCVAARRKIPGEMRSDEPADAGHEHAHAANYTSGWARRFTLTAARGHGYRETCTASRIEDAEHTDAKRLFFPLIRVVPGGARPD
jgi:hypothetical protein